MEKPRPISISLSPNTEKDDILLAFKLLFQPWKWKKGKAIEEIENEFKGYLGIKHAISFNSGRSSLMAILTALFKESSSAGALATKNPVSFETSADKEVILQAFTCSAAANPIIWSGLKPVYADCGEKTFNIDANDLKKKITNKSKAVMVQHTFGLPADMDEVMDICRENNLILIEDCAHSLGSAYKGRKVGLFGKAAFFSFSRDKIISSVYGGIAATNDDELAKKLREFQKKIGSSSNFWIFQQLLHPILMNWLVLPVYRILGKYLLILFQGFKILSKAIHWKEKRGERPDYFPKRLPNGLAILALNQFKKLENFNSHRKEIAQFYFQALRGTSFQVPEISDRQNPVFLRFAVKHFRASEIIKKAWKKNLLIGDWYTAVIAPFDTKLDKMRYISGSCPKAEKLSKETFNLPTHINITRKEAQKVIDFLEMEVFAKR